MKDLMRAELLEFAARGRGGGAAPEPGGEEFSARLDRLVAAQELPRDEFLRRFGRHLFGRFAAVMPVFVAGEDSALPFLAGLEGRVHEALRQLGPALSPPRLDCAWRDRETLVIDYRSPRRLADLALGLLEGCGEHFGEELAIARSPLPDGDGERFVLTRRTRAGEPVGP